MLGAEKMPTSKERLDYIESWKKIILILSVSEYLKGKKKNTRN